MATKSGKTSVDESGLRFTSRENGSPFAGMGKMGETMSCIKCGMHKPRRQGSQQRFAGSLAFSAMTANHQSLQRLLRLKQLK